MRRPPRYLPALITPFTRSGHLDLEAHAHNVELLSTTGIEGFLIAGSNGEGPYLEPGERRGLIEAAREALGRRTYLMSGVMGESLRLAEAQIAEAAEAGADSVLVLTPTTLVRGRHDLVERFFVSVADRSPLPVFLYSVPATTAYSLPAPVIRSLAGHPNVAGIKDSSGDPVRIQALTGSPDDGLLVFNGASRSIALAMAAGAHGAITGSGNYAPTLVQELVASARRSPTRAMPLQRRLAEMSAEIEKGGVADVKAASRGAGLNPGFPRPPLGSPTRGRARALEALAATALEG